MIAFRKPGLVAYVTCGDPSLDVTHDVVLAAIDAGADVMELGVPFSDPVADGVVIQRASERALAKGTSLNDVLQLAGSIRKQRPQAGLIIFSYLNPILRYGLERFAAQAKTIGLDGALVTDLIVEEAADYLAIMRRQKLATIFLAVPTSTDVRLKQIAKASTGFVYAVSRTGITGSHAAADLQGETRQLVSRLRRFTRLPIAVGFGISTAAQVHSACRYADAAVVGSAIVKLIEDAGPHRAALAIGDWIKSLKSNSSAADASGSLRAK